MGNDAIDRISIRMFGGFLLSTELRMHLHQSNMWKQLSALHLASSTDLLEITHENHLYVGQYFIKEHLTLGDLRESCIFMKQTLQPYCPKYDVDALKFYIFPQVFVI